MRSRLVSLTAVLGVTAAATVAVTSAGASDYHGYYGYAGGSMVRAANMTITSDLTAQATAYAIDANASDSEHTANVAAAGLLTADAVSTSSAIKPVTGGREVVSTSRTAGVSLLDGAIKVDAVTTTTTVGFVNGKPKTSVATTFAGLHIAGQHVPVTIPQNYALTIPGLATVVLNQAQAYSTGTDAAATGAGIFIDLLKPLSGNDPGSTVYVSPTYGYTAANALPNTGHAVEGESYGTSVNAKAGTVAALTSDPTAPNSVPLVGTKGVAKSTSVAGIKVASVVSTGAISSTGVGTNTTSLASVSSATKIAHVSLLGGMITLDAVTAWAHAQKPTAGKLSTSGVTSFGDLVIAGKKYALTVKPNTTISLGKLGKVVLNEQTRSGNAITVRALHVTLSTAGYGLQAGAQIQVAYAHAEAA